MAGRITVEQAQQLLREIVAVQVAALDAQQRNVEALSAETRAYVDKTRNDVDKSLIDNKAAAEAYVVQEVGALKAQTETHVGHVESKVEDMRSRLLQHDRTQDESAAKSKLLVEKLESFAAEVQSTIKRTQTEVLQTQRAIQALIDSTQHDNSSTILRSGAGHERDRAVFDPRDYKIDVLLSQFALGVWKKWRHEVEIYIDTIGPGWRGVKLLLQQARRSPTPLDPDRESMSGVIERAKPLPVATSAAPVKTENSLTALEDSAPVKCVLDSVARQ